jgi:hypothetical protein
MARRLARVLMGLVLALGVPACAPKLVGPTAGSGYVFSLQTYPETIWVGVLDLTAAARYPQTAEVIVRVQDAQGRAVDGVPVTFELEPRWANSAVLAPSQTTTRGGIARAVFSEPRTSGLVRVMVHVDNTTAQTRLTVQTYEAPTSRD